ncbi:MAG TPA: SUMF1/EgtB/PvdO family nonheme iron enzyme [Ktedonobacterales bacterium]
MLYKRSHATRLIVLLPIAAMVLLAAATVLSGNLAAGLAPGAALNPTFWGCLLLVESAVFCLTALSLPKPRLVLSQEHVIVSPLLGRELKLNWQDIQRVTVTGRAGARQTVRLTVPRAALLRGSILHRLAHRGDTATVPIQTAGWRLRYSRVSVIDPPPARALEYYFQTPTARAALGTEEKLEEAAAPSATPARGRQASWAALMLAFALQLSSMVAFNPTLTTPALLQDTFGRYLAILFVLCGVGCYLAGTFGWRVAGAFAPILICSGVLLRIVFALSYAPGGLLSMYFDMRGSWSLLWLILPDVPRVVMTPLQPARRTAEERLSYNRALGIGLTLFLVLGPMFQDYLNVLYGNATYALMSIRDAAFLPYAAIFIWALSVLSADKSPAIQRLLVLLQSLTGLGIVAVTGLFALGYAQVMATLNAWQVGYHATFDVYTLRQSGIAVVMGLIIAVVAWHELARLSAGRPVRQALADARTLGAHLGQQRRAKRQWDVDPGLILALFTNHKRLHAVFACLLLLFFTARFVAITPVAAQTCCTVSPLAAQPPASAAPGAHWVRPVDGMTMIFIPRGTVAIGLPADAVATETQLCLQEYGPQSAACNAANFAVSLPQHQVQLAGYWIDETDVTNAQFARFVAATGYVTDAQRYGWGWVWEREGGDTRLPGASWRQPLGPGSTISGEDANPVVQVSWHDAQAYAAWVGMKLPSEEQWEYAAHGLAFQPFPWGSSVPDGSQANLCDRHCPRWKPGTGDDGYAYTSPAGHYPAGASPYGVLDMAGNVLQWTRSIYAPYPGASYTDPLYGKGDFVARGGTYAILPAAAYTTIRDADSPDIRMEYIGFRCATAGAPQG